MFSSPLGQEHSHLPAIRALMRADDAPYYARWTECPNRANVRFCTIHANRSPGGWDQTQSTPRYPRGCRNKRRIVGWDAGPSMAHDVVTPPVEVPSPPPRFPTPASSPRRRGLFLCLIAAVPHCPFTLVLQVAVLVVPHCRQRRGQLFGRGQLRSTR